MPDQNAPTPGAEGVDEAPLEAGQVNELQEELEVTPYDPRPAREGTAKLLAVLFFSLLAAIFVMHYIGTLILVAQGKADGVTQLKSSFDVMLPVSASLASSAATYYFTKERHR